MKFGKWSAGEYKGVARWRSPPEIKRELFDGVGWSPIRRFSEKSGRRTFYCDNRRVPEKVGGLRY